MPRRATPRIDTALFSVGFSGLGASLLAGAAEQSGPLRWGMFASGMASLGWAWIAMGRQLPHWPLPSTGLALTMPRLGGGSEFIFESRELKGVITETRLMDFCQIAVRRHAHYYHSYRKARMWGDKPRLTRTMVLSARYFVGAAMFTYDEVTDCKHILKRNRLIVDWKPGHGGMLVIVNAARLVEISKRNYYPPTVLQRATQLKKLIRN